MNQTVKPTTSLGFFQSFDRPTDTDRIYNYSQFQSHQFQSQYRPSESYVLSKHELYPGFVHQKPMSLSKLPNLSRDIETVCATNERHYVGKSFTRIFQLYFDDKFDQIVSFCMEAVNDILRENTRKFQINQNYIGADNHVFLEICALHGVISAPTFTELTDLYKLSEKQAEKPQIRLDARNTSHHKTNVYQYESSLGQTQPCQNQSKKHIRFSDSQTQDKGHTVSSSNNVHYKKEEARMALRILVDFLKQEEQKERSLKFQPFISEMVNHRQSLM